MQPKNLEEAQKYRYGRRGGKPEGRRLYSSYCAYEVLGTLPAQFDQCLRKAGHGTDKIFCKQHAKMMESNNG